MRFLTANDGTTNTIQNPDMTLWDGKLGIGTVSPSSELHVIGTANISNLVQVTGNSNSAAIYGKFGNVALGNHYAF